MENYLQAPCQQLIIQSAVVQNSAVSALGRTGYISVVLKVITCNLWQSYLFTTSNVVGETVLMGNILNLQQYLDNQYTSWCGVPDLSAKSRAHDDIIFYCSSRMAMPLNQPSSLSHKQLTFWYCRPWLQVSPKSPDGAPSKI